MLATCSQTTVWFDSIYNNSILLFSGRQTHMLMELLFGNSQKLNSALAMTVKTDKNLHPKPMKATMAPVGRQEPMYLDSLSGFNRQSKLFKR